MGFANIFRTLKNNKKFVYCIFIYFLYYYFILFQQVCTIYNTPTIITPFRTKNNYTNTLSRRMLNSKKKKIVESCNKSSMET